ncbi:hypothetical protein BGW38_000140 [Lunasporangiospora selenospora]|uniref:SH3 domain-containing protein n=1 Tax=Lunasporangiospora selenospora TaxID=979761 RepID=A0A9P6FVY2_9FUNG|nr:hypothetical protein BGW38_000140 [Lunasporangiospora selenospora]
MASSPGHGAGLTKEQQHQQLGTAQATYPQDQDAIVPASDNEQQEPIEDDSTEEDEEYVHYIQEQEKRKHQQQQQQQRGQNDSDEAEGIANTEDTRLMAQQGQPHPQQRHHQHQQIQLQYQLQQQQHREAYKSQAMNIHQLLQHDQSMDQDEYGSDSQEEEEFYQQNPQHDPQRQYQTNTLQHQQLQHQQLRQLHVEGHDEDDEDDDEFSDHDDQVDEEMDLDDDEDDDDEDDDDDLEDDDDEMDDDDDGSETFSLTEDDIDFNLVYAFHTFVATQEGQASVVRNDSLVLLEDTNVYWWLVRVQKTGVIGYIPAENIETPHERLARLNTYRNVSLSAPSPEWGTFDEHPQPMDPALLAQRAMNRKSVIFRSHNDFLEASETEWTSEEEEEEEEDGDWYEEGGEDEQVAEDDDDDEDYEQIEVLEMEDEGEDDAEDQTESMEEIEVAHVISDATHRPQEQQENRKTSLQLEAERVQQEILEDQRKLSSMTAGDSIMTDSKVQFKDDASKRPIQSSSGVADNEDEEEEAPVTNRYRKPILEDADLMITSNEPRIISLTPAIARDDNARAPTPGSKPRNLNFPESTSQSVTAADQKQKQQQEALQKGNKAPISPTTGLRSPNYDSEEDDKNRSKLRPTEMKEAKANVILGKINSSPVVRKSKEEYEAGLPPEAVVTKKPGKFKSLFGVGKSSKDKEKKEKERQEKERQEKEKLKNQAKSSGGPPNSISSGASNLFRTRSNSSSSLGSANTANGSSLTGQSTSPSSSTTYKDKGSSVQPEYIALRVYPGNVDFGASMYKTVVVTATTTAADVAHQAVVKFRLAPDGTASTGDFYLTVRGVDGDETVLLATDKPMAIYQSLTAHLTTPLPANHRLSISSVSSMLSTNSTTSFSSNNGSPNSNFSGTSLQPTLKRTGSGRSEPQQRSIRFMLNKKIRRSSSVLTSSSVAAAIAASVNASGGSSAAQDDSFWVKVVCEAQDLPHSMLFLEGMGMAIDKTDPRAHDQSFASKVEHWIPMKGNSNAGDVIFRAIERIGIRSGVVDGVPEHVLATKRVSIPNGLVIEYQLAFRIFGNSSKKLKAGEESTVTSHLPLSRCFDEHRVAPIRRSPKADVASMPPNPDYVFFLRKSAKSLQAEMRLIQEQMQHLQSQTGSSRSSPVALHASILRPTDSEPSTSARSSPNALAPASSSSSPGIQNRGISVTSTNRVVSGSSSPIRIPRRTDSVILTSANPPMRAASFESSGRPSPTLSAHSQTAIQPIQTQQISRTPTPDRHQSSPQMRALSPGATGQSSPTAQARSLQAPSPAPSTQSVNQSGVGQEQENNSSRASTPDRSVRAERSERQRATSPVLTHGPSPLSMSAVMVQSEHGVAGGGGEEIDITEIIEDILGQGSEHSMDQDGLRTGGDADDFENDQDQDEDVEGDQRELDRDSAAGKERRRTSASSQSVSSIISSALRAARKSSGPDRDRLEQLGSSGRGGETLLKLERALAGDSTPQPASSSSLSSFASSSSATGGMSELTITEAKGSDNRNLPSPMSLASSTSAPSSPVMNKRISDGEVQIASVTTVSATAAARMQQHSGSPSLTTSDQYHTRSSSSPGPSSPLAVSHSPTYARPTLLANVNEALHKVSGGGSNPSSPSFGASVSHQRQPSENRSTSPQHGRIQSPGSSPASLGPSTSSGTLSKFSIHTGVSTTGGFPAGPVSAGALDRSPNPSFMQQSAHSRSRSASASTVSDITRATPPSRGFASTLTTVTDVESSGTKESSSPMTSPKANDPWLLSSDYNTGMQDLLTLVRAGRSSSVSAMPMSSTITSASATAYIRAMTPQSSPSLSGKRKESEHSPRPRAAMSPGVENALVSPQLSPQPSPSLRGGYSPGHHPQQYSRQNQSLQQQQFKDTQQQHGRGSHHANEQGMGEYGVASAYPAARGENGEEAEQYDQVTSMPLSPTQTPSGSRIWNNGRRPSRDQRLRDVKNDCHPEVFECWQNVDADLDKVEKELDSLLATVKATVF